MSVKKMVRCRQGVLKVIGVTPTPLRFGDKVRAAGFWRRGSLLTGEEIAHMHLRLAAQLHTVLASCARVRRCHPAHLPWRAVPGKSAGFAMTQPI